MSMIELDELVKQQLRDDDRAAWTAVCGILMTIIGIGVGIAVLAVLIITF